MDYAVGQLAAAYRLCLQAKAQQQPELAQLSAWYGFDLLDWARRNLAGFSDATLLSGFAADAPEDGNPATVGELERRIEQEMGYGGDGPGEAPSPPPYILF
jgi:hypothetical protein